LSSCKLTEAPGKVARLLQKQCLGGQFLKSKKEALDKRGRRNCREEKVALLLLKIKSPLTGREQDRATAGSLIATKRRLKGTKRDETSDIWGKRWEV